MSNRSYIERAKSNCNRNSVVASGVSRVPSANQTHSFVNSSGSWNTSGVTMSPSNLEEPNPRIIIRQNGKELVNSNELPEDIEMSFKKGKCKDITLFGEKIEKKSIKEIVLNNDYTLFANSGISIVVIDLKPKLSPSQEQVVTNVIMQINL